MGSLFDNDKYKNVMGRISQPIGKYLDIGIFGYSGKQLVKEAPGFSEQQNKNVRTKSET